MWCGVVWCFDKRVKGKGKGKGKGREEGRALPKGNIDDFCFRNTHFSPHQKETHTLFSFLHIKLCDKEIN